MSILFGKPIRDSLETKYTKEIANFSEKLKLSIIQIGDDPASNKYINSKVNFGKKIGIDVEILKYSSNVSEKEILDEIKMLNEDEITTAILVQLPISKHLDTYKITQAINYKKDVDGFNEKNIAKMYLNEQGLYPGTSRGIIKILQYYNIPIKGQNVVIAGASNLVGKNLAVMLINLGATVTSCNSKTKNIKEYTKYADIFISAIGKGEYFDQSYFQTNRKTVIIDVGINFIEDRMVGDVDFTSVEQVAKEITPVPGGVGVLTVAMLMDNIIKAHKIQKGIL